ncbi:hypothetical protein D3C73_1186370 [compost metagenome]
MVQQRRAGHRQVGDAPGADQVAEVDHALQLPLALPITLPDHVVIGDVHVDGLYRQLVHQWPQSLICLLGGLRDQGTLAIVLDHRQQVRDQCVGVAGVPLQGALQAGMAEIGQCQVHFTAQPTKTGHHRPRQMVQLRERLPLDVLEQTHVHCLPCDFERKQIGAGPRFHHPRHLHLGMIGQMFEPGVLGLQLQRRIVAPADFQDKTPLGAVDAKVQVLLAAKRLQATAQPVMPLEQL